MRSGGLFDSPVDGIAAGDCARLNAKGQTGCAFPARPAEVNASAGEV